MSARRRPGNFRFFGLYTFFVPNGAELAILTALFIAGALLGNIVTAVVTLLCGSGIAAEYGTLVAYPLMFIPAMMYASARSRTNSMNRSGLKLDSTNFGKTGGLLCALTAMVATLAAAFCGDAFSMLLPEMPTWLKEMLEGLTQGNFWINFLMVSIFAPLFEEWLCRGMVLRGMLGNGVKPWIAIILSALFFAIIHLNPWQAIPAFMIGCLFGYVYYKTGSLRLTMLMHFTNNSFALLLGRFDVLKDADNWLDVLSRQQYFTIFAACVLLVILAVRVFARIQCTGAAGGAAKVPCIFDEKER